MLRDRLSLRRSAAITEDPFDPGLFSMIDRMRLRITRAYGARAGETPVRGLTQESGIEIESFKTYAPGDDIRYVDWNAVGRLDQLLTRRFVAEREIPVHLLIDASASMATPAADRKFAFAVRLVAALAYIALNNNDPVRVAALHHGPAGPQVMESPMLHHHGRFLRLKPVLADLAASGRTALLEGVTQYLGRHRERGVALLASDFLVPAEVYETALSRLLAHRLQVHAIQVVGEEERDLGRTGGRLRLRDVETGATREIVLSAAQRRRYAAAFAERIEKIRGFCHGAGIGHAVVCPRDGVEHCLTQILSVSGMLRLR